MPVEAVRVGVIGLGFMGATHVAAFKSAANAVKPPPSTNTTNVVNRG